MKPRAQGSIPEFSVQSLLETSTVTIRDVGCEGSRHESAEERSYAQVGIAESLRGLRVRDVMEKERSVVDGRSNLQTLVDDHLLRTGRRCFFVVDHGRVAGLVTPHEIKEVGAGSDGT